MAMAHFLTGTTADCIQIARGDIDRKRATPGIQTRRSHSLIWF